MTRFALTLVALVKTIDVTGREVNPAYQMVFRLYSDGTTEKAIVGDQSKWPPTGGYALHARKIWLTLVFAPLFFSAPTSGDRLAPLPRLRQELLRTRLVCRSGHGGRRVTSRPAQSASGGVDLLPRRQHRGHHFGATQISTSTPCH